MPSLQEIFARAASDPAYAAGLADAPGTPPALRDALRAGDPEAMLALMGQAADAKHGGPPTPGAPTAPSASAVIAAPTQLPGLQLTLDVQPQLDSQGTLRWAAQLIPGAPPTPAPTDRFQFALTLWPTQDGPQLQLDAELQPRWPDSPPADPSAAVPTDTPAVQHAAQAARDAAPDARLDALAALLDALRPEGGP